MLEGPRLKLELAQKRHPSWADSCTPRVQGNACVRPCTSSAPTSLLCGAHAPSSPPHRAHVLPCQSGEAGALFCLRLTHPRSPSLRFAPEHVPAMAEAGRAHHHCCVPHPPRSLMPHHVQHRLRLTPRCAPVHAHHSRFTGSFLGPCSDHRRHAHMRPGYNTLPPHGSGLAVSTPWPSGAM